jgi:hypothetical protein
MLNLITIYLQNVIRVLKLKIMLWEFHVSLMGKARNAQKIVFKYQNEFKNVLHCEYNETY